MVFFEEVNQQLKLLLSQISNEKKLERTTLFSKSISLKNFFSAAKILEKWLEGNKLIATSCKPPNLLKITEAALKCVCKNKCLENFKEILRETFLVECILFILYLPKPDSIANVFLKRKVRYSYFSGHLWMAVS